MSEGTYFEGDDITVIHADEAAGIAVRIKRRSTREARCFEATLSPAEFSPAQQDAIFTSIKAGDRIHRGNGYFYFHPVYA